MAVPITTYRQRLVAMAISLLMLLLVTGCQWPLAYQMRDQVFPEDTATKIALSPILLPTYVVCAVTDMAIVNPVRGTKNIPDTATTIWNWENEQPWLGYGLLMPLKLVAIPPAALGTMMFSEQFASQDDAPEPTVSGD